MRRDGERPAREHAARPLAASAQVLALQRSAGNKATSSLLSGPTLQRQPKPPAYDKCAATGVANIDVKIENGRQRAISYVQVAIRALKGDPNAPSADRAYKTALQRHFRGPDAAGRATIQANFEKILAILKSHTRIRCASSQFELERCQKKTDLFGFVLKGGDTIIVCPNIADESIRCRAIGLIHEAAHIINIGAGDTHPPYRGTDEYPWPSSPAKAPAEQTAAVRLDNPEAYGYFAAHVWRESDTSCPPAFVPGEIIINIEGTAPTP
jgi:hypothetical protein